MKNTWPCPGKPEDLKGQPIGMYHCAYCGEMQLAGTLHLPPQSTGQWEEPFPKIDYSEVSEPKTVVTEIDVACPSCHAQPGEPCKLITMPYQPVNYFHTDRGS